MAKRTCRSKSVIPKAVVTKTSRKYACGGKLKKKK